MVSLLGVGAEDFNPRSREGSDIGCPYRRIHGGDFNPRSREGSDFKDLRRIAFDEEFQSTLP